LPQKKEKQMYRPVLLILLMIRVWTGAAQEGVVRLSLDDALERFAACNLSLIAERYHVDMAEAQVTQAKLFENPVISFEQNVYNRNNGKYFDLGKEGEAVVEIEQLIYIAGQRNKRVRLEKLNKEMAVYQFEEVIRTLRGELKEKFVDLYYTRKSLSVYDREIGYLSTVLDVYKEQNAKGNVSLLEKSRIQALLLSLKQERNGISNEAVALEGDLRLLLGLKREEVPEPLFDESALDRIELEKLPLAELSARMAGRPDLKQAEAGIRASEADVRLQRSLAFPEVSLKGAYDRAGNFCNNYFAIGLSVSVPLFNRNQGNIKSARLSVLRNNTLAEQARRQADNELFACYTKLAKALELYRSSDYELERDFDRIIEGVNAGFRKRNISLLEFIDYYEAYKETCLQLYGMKRDVVMAAEGLNIIVGDAFGLIQK
jgi:outer membrane protein, heavy metal efflux system